MPRDLEFDLARVLRDPFVRDELNRAAGRGEPCTVPVPLRVVPVDHGDTIGSMLARTTDREFVMAWRDGGGWRFARVTREVGDG